MEQPAHPVLLGVPSAAGASGPGVEGGFAALRAAGLVEALRSLDARLEDRGHLSLFPFREDPDHPRARNASGVACAAQAVVEELLLCAPASRPIVVGGGCSIGVGVVAAIARLTGRAPGIVLFDAHADLNTPATSPSGVLDGMALALSLGRAPGPLHLLAGDGGWPPPERAALIGVREIDPEERAAAQGLGRLSTADDAGRVSTTDEVTAALDVVSGRSSFPVVVHVDLDVVEPSEMQPKAGGPPGPGLPASRLAEMLRAFWASPLVSALVITGFDPNQDPDGGLAARLVDLLVSSLRR